MIHSMTGYASSSFLLDTHDGKTHISIIIKSLNNRYFETHYKLAQPLQAIEHTITKLLKKKLRRGSIYCSIFVSNPSVFKGAIEPDITTVKRYIHAFEQIKKAGHLDAPITLDHIVRLPNIFISEEQEIDHDSLQRILEKIDTVITKVIDARATEGNMLLHDLTNQITYMNQELAIIEERSHLVMQEQKNKIAHIFDEANAHEQEIAEMRKTALYQMLDKIDIHEEITRFTSHIKNLHEQINAHNPDNGKRIDFTLQELAREINTIAAKCSDATIGTHAINIKVAIEKAREQAQNIV